MARSIIKRLQRLMRLTEYIHGQKSLEALKADEARGAVMQSLDVTRQHIGSGSIVERAFPTLLGNRTVKLETELRERDEAAVILREAAASSKASIKGLEGRLRRAVGDRLQADVANELEDAIDRYVRSRRASSR